MSQSNTRRAPAPVETTVCPTCGGRGALRLGDESCRTCLHCLGQGRVPAMQAATTTAEVLNQGALLQNRPAEPRQPVAVQG